MSLVQAILSSQFVLVCGEQQANLSDGTVRHDFRKVFKINKNVIIGLTGTIEDNYILFQDYINPDFTLKETCSDSLEAVYSKVILRYNQMKISGMAYNVFSLVCGWNGNSFEGKTFFMNHEYTDNLGITDIKLKSDNDVKFISCGENEHYDNFFKIKDRYPFNVRGMMNTFNDVLAEGVKFDKTIDKNAVFEVIIQLKK